MLHTANRPGQRAFRRHWSFFIQLDRSEYAKRRHAPGFARRRQKSWRVALALGSRGRLSLRVRRLGGCPACHTVEISPTLLRNHTAGDAVAGIARGVGLLIVGLGVRYDCGASVAEQRMAVAAERDVFILPLEMRFAVRVHGEVGVVAGVVTFRILQSMLLSIGIEVASRGLEVRGVALRVLMEVDSVFAWRQIFEIDFHLHARGRFPKNGGTYNLALGIFELNQNLGRTG